MLGNIVSAGNKVVKTTTTTKKPEMMVTLHFNNFFCSSTGSLTKGLSGLGPKPGAGNSVQVSFVGDKNPSRGHSQAQELLVAPVPSILHGYSGQECCPLHTLSMLSMEGCSHQEPAPAAKPCSAAV